jgi:hypothetical protein
MNIGTFLNQLNNFIPEMLQELLLEIQSVEWTEKWFAEKIYQIVKLNLLSKEEIEEVFGWDKGDLKTLCDFYTGETVFSGLGFTWKERYRHKMFALFSLLAFKHQLQMTITLQPIVTTEPVRIIPEPLVPWHMPLLELGWYEEVPKSAQRLLTAAAVLTLGELLIKTEDGAYEIIQAYNTVARIRNILERQGLKFASVTDEDYQLYMSHRAETPSADE